MVPVAEVASSSALNQLLKLMLWGIKEQAIS